MHMLVILSTQLMTVAVSRFVTTEKYIKSKNMKYISANRR